MPKAFQLHISENL